MAKGDVKVDDHNSEAVALVERFLDGKEDASQELYDRLKPVVWNSVSRVLGPGRASDWEDASQIAFMRLFAGLRTWRKECSLTTFAAVVSVRVAIDMIRTRSVILLDPDHSVFVERVANEPDLAALECFKRKLAGFRPLWRTALRLKSEGLKTQEIAKELGRSVTCIQSWMREMYHEMVKCLDR